MKSRKQILIDLAREMGLDSFWQSVTQTLDHRLEPVGMTFEAFKEKRKISTPITYQGYEQKGRFRTPTGKVELYADYLNSMGISPLPIFREPAESPVSSPDLEKEYPLILTTGGRNLVYYHSSHRNIESLHKKSPHPELQIYPETAERMGIHEGEWVFLASPRGKIEIKIRYDRDLHPKVVHSPHGYWYGVDNGWQRVNINMLTDDQLLCPVTASVPIKALLCRLEKMNL